MHERRFSAAVERLRSAERLEKLEVARVVELSLGGIDAASVLDVGTGSGVFAEAFAARGLTVTGIDPNYEMLPVAREFVPSGKFQSGTVEKIPFPDASYDLVFLGHVLHESDDLAVALAECKRCTRQRVAILEWPYLEEESGPPLRHRLTSDDVRASANALGYSRCEEISLRHMVLFLLTP